MPNHLINQSSPYLLQHANNPVDWYPWGLEALSRSKVEEKPIFLSIGYAACHWCHVMERESFEDQATADILNQHFISIKVDREERPDLDGIYMAAVVAMSQQGGWPMSVFLTPDLKPFFGGTYFPPVARHGLPAFREVLTAVHAAWTQEREKVLHVAEHIIDEIRHNNILRLNFQPMLKPEILAEALGELLSSYDWAYGGWGRAPKFPQPMLLDFLLLHGASGSQGSLDAVLHALDAMSRGGMYDVIGGGFHRYSTDSGWLVPHFEKMLYDNAQLALTYLRAYLLTGEERFRLICEQTLDFILREMRHPQGGFYSSIDADSAGSEGQFYTWEHDELSKIVTSTDEWEILRASYEVPQQGNFNGRLILQRRQSFSRASAELGINLNEYVTRLNEIHLKLRDFRELRVRPATDDKILTAWNGLAIIALAEAGRFLQRDEYLQAAQQCASFIQEYMTDGRKLFRSWHEGNSGIPAFLEDYAALILGLLTLYQADGNTDWFTAAKSFTDELIESFQDPAGGFFDTALSNDDLPFRPKDVQDNATPSGGSLTAKALITLSALTGDDTYLSHAETMLAMVQEGIAQYPTAFGGWLIALDAAINPLRQIAVVWDAKTNLEEVKPLLDVPHRHYYPRTVLAFSPLPPPDGSPALLEDRPTVNGKPAAYVCHNFVCQLPVTDPFDLQHQLR